MARIAANIYGVREISGIRQAERKIEMSYDIHFKDPKTGEAIEFDERHLIRGGTYAIDGTSRAWLNITYNYAPFYYQLIDRENGIRSLYGKSGAEAIPILEAAIAKLGTYRSGYYWEATPGNAGAALNDLLTLCKMAPHGVLDGD